MATIAPIIKDVPALKLETELVVWNNQLLEISFNRTWSGTSSTSFTVSDYFTGEVLATKAWTGGMGCAIVKDGVIHIFGNTAWTSNNNKIIHSTLDANFNPSPPNDALLVNSTFKFYNTSICEDANGYRMVAETTVGTYFARSTSLTGLFTFYGGQLAQGSYVGCPTIDYVNGAHYITYLKNVSGKFVTQVAKSTNNCFAFTYFNGNANYPAGSYLLDPVAVVEGNNNSDASFVEYNGAVYGCYLNGNQTSIAQYKKFSYNGTLAQLFSEFM